MNKIQLNKHVLTASDTSVKFCRKLINSKDERCLGFLESKEIGLKRCPYDYACAKSYDTVYCGFYADGYSDLKSVKGHNKNSNSGKVECLSYEDFNVLYQIAILNDYCSIYSQTTHDLIHFTGQLKTLIDESYNYSKNDSFISSLIKEYQKYISLIDTYQKKKLQNHNEFLKLLNPSISDKKIFLERNLEIYKNLIDSVADVSSRISFSIKENSIMETYKDKYVLMSLIAVQSLFDFRIKYHHVTFSELFFGKEAVSLEKVSMDWHKIAKKLTNTLSYLAKSKNLYFRYDGKTFESFVAKENIYLGLYILLENALKYTSSDNENDIYLRFEDTENECVLYIENPSDYISEESMKKITTKGFSGENSKNGNSNGIGLFVAKKIFDDSDVSVAFKYEDGLFSVRLSAKR